VNHTRSDYPQPTSPRVPRPVGVCTLRCSREIEMRIRRLQTWHASPLGYMADQAVDTLVSMCLTNTLAIEDLQRLLHEQVYSLVLSAIADARGRR
jgi:hypothetical protein